MLCHLALIRTDVSEELCIRLLLVTANVVPSLPIRVTLIMDALHSSNTSVLARATWITSKKRAFFIIMAVKTSDLTRNEVLFVLKFCN
jgi:hypothetical protein